MTTDAVNNDILIAAYSITANGTALTKDMLNTVIYAEVEQNLYLPAMAIIKFRNRKLESTVPTSFAIGNEVVIKMSQSPTALTEVFKGEVVAQDFDFSPTGTPTITIRAYDKSHRMMRDRKTRTFVQSKDSDLVSQIAGEAGLSPGAEATAIVYDWLIQNNETNYEFLMRRALRIGFEMYVDAGTTLKFRKPVTTGSPVATLTWALDLLDFKLRFNASKQVDKVNVRGWDFVGKQAIVGSATTAAPLNAPGVSADGGAKAKAGFGGAAAFDGLYQYVFSQTEAQNVATAILNDINGRYVQCQGRCIGNAAIKIGTLVKVKGIGTDYEGNYYITSVTHRFDVEGFATYFESNGKNTNSVMEMVNQIDKNGGGRMLTPVIGTVSNNKDDKKMGRVKVKYPTFGDNIESDWIPFVTPMTGTAYGLQFIPEVNDQVIIAFANGDINNPFIVGGAWNGKDAPPLDSTSADVIGGDGKVNQRVLKTRSGHIVTFNDSSDKPGISIVDKTGNNKIVIDSTANNINMESDANITLKATKGTVTIDAKDIEFKATQNIKSTATQNIEMTATQNVKATASINFEAKGSAAAKMEGATVDVKASGGAKIDGGAMTEVKGGIIKLN